MSVKRLSLLVYRWFFKLALCRAFLWEIFNPVIFYLGTKRFRVQIIVLILTCGSAIKKKTTSFALSSLVNNLRLKKTETLFVQVVQYLQAL